MSDDGGDGTGPVVPDLDGLVAWCARVLGSAIETPDAATPPEPPPLPAHLAGPLDRHGFDRFDATILAIVLAPDLDPALGYATAALHRDRTRHRPTVDLLARLAGARGAARTAVAMRLSPGAPLVRIGLVAVSPAGSGSPSFADEILPTEALLRWVTGLSALDEDLQPAVTLGARRPAAPPDVAVAERLRARFGVPGPSLTHLRAEPPGIGVDCATWAAARLGRPVLHVRAAALEAAGPAVRVAAEAVLRDAVVVVADPWDAVPAGRWTALVDTVVVGGISSLPPDNDVDDVVSLAVHRGADHDPARELAAALRRRSIVPDADLADRVGGWEHLAGDDVERVADGLAALARGRGSDRVRAADLSSVAEAVTAAPLARFATPLATTTDRTDLSVPEPVQAALEDLGRQAAGRRDVLDRLGFAARPGQGRGVTALFAGPSGTGKTLAARLVAGRLGLPLYRIDLSRVVSKYIGETERNLDEVFAAAEGVDAVLLFDEAEALFGKRSEVNDAHDRYANLEVAFLLQRMESYDGVALLATNLLSNMDDAFARRLSFCVHFPFPDERQRALIWRRVWPRGLELGDDVDPDELAAGPVLSGGQIRNVAVAAAHLASAAGRPIDRAAIMRAVGRELEKIGLLPDPLPEPVVP